MYVDGCQGNLPWLKKIISLGLWVGRRACIIMLSLSTLTLKGKEAEVFPLVGG